MAGSLYATNIGALSPWGVPGWRFAFLSVGLTSWVIGLAALAWAVDPRWEITVGMPLHMYDDV